MKKTKIKAVCTAAVLLLFFAFTISVLFVLMLLTQSYRSAAVSSELSYSERTCISYISEKLRHGDSEGAVYVGKFDGVNALFIDTVFGDVPYSSIIYFYNGWLCELFCEKGADFRLADGTRIIETKAVSFSELQPSLFYIEVTNLSGKTDKLHIFLRSGGEI